MTRPKVQCAHCGELFAPEHHLQLYCTPEHRGAARMLRKTRGQVVVAQLQAWRLSRNAKGSSAEAKAARKAGAEALAEVCRIVDAWNTEDRTRGAMSPLAAYQRAARMDHGG